MVQSIATASRSVLLAVLVSVPVLAGAQDADLSARLQRATALTSLNAIDQKPWHLKLDVTVFDDAGKNPRHGTIEVWRSGEDTRETGIFGADTYTRLQHGEEVYWGSTGSALPYRVSEILQQVLHPGPTRDDLSSSTPTLHKVKLGKVPVDCIMLTQTVKGVDKLPLGLYPTFCLKADGDQILVTYNFGSRTVVIRSFGNFLDHVIPMQMEIQDQSVVVATSKIDALSTYKPQLDEFVPAPEMQRATANIARIPGGVLAGNIITKVQPVYPATARADHIGGTVVLHAIIGSDGHVYALRPISSPYPDLTISALAAVRQWTYKPYLLNGNPVEVDTTITVNYNLNSSSLTRLTR